MNIDVFVSLSGVDRNFLLLQIYNIPKKQANMKSIFLLGKTLMWAFLRANSKKKGLPLERDKNKKRNFAAAKKNRHAVIVRLLRRNG